MDQNITAAPPAGSTEPTPAPATPATPAAPKGPWTPSLKFIAVLIAVLAFFLGAFRANNSDIWLTLATGKLLATGEYQFGVDPFSWASEGSYWANSSWLSSWLAYGIFQMAGPGALVGVKAGLVVLLAWLLFAVRPKDGSLLTSLEITALVVLASSFRFLLQSTMLSFVGMGALVLLLFRGGYLGGFANDDKKQTNLLWQIPLLFFVWSNCDGYFVLGLISLALVAIGLAIVASTRNDGVEVAKIFGLSLVACVLNPHHIHNLALPNDIGYTLNWLVPSAAGTTAEAVQSLNFFTPISPFSATAIFNPNFAYNIAGFSIYLLFLINIASFVAAGLMPDKKALIVRGLLCLATGVFAAVQLRMVPFYAVVAGPISVLNFADCNRWSNLSARVSRNGRAFATSMTMITLAVAVAAAWPGWLHMGFSQFQEDTLFTSGRRVEFDIPIDESLHQAALTLHSNKVAKVYNGSIEIANYCAYFTPDVKCGMDLRFGLFAPRAAEYAALRNDLIDSFVESFGGKSTRHAKAGDAKAAANKTVGDWGIEALAFANFRPVTQAAMNNTNLLVTFLLRQPSHWKPTLVDGQSTVFLHERNIVSPDLDLLAQFNRQAFGPLPQAKWLPNRPAELPPSGANWADLYVRGPGHIPLDNSTARFQLDAYQHLSGAWVAPYFVASQAMNSLAAAAPALGGQGPMVGVQAKVSIDLGGLFFRTPSRGEPTSFRGRDPGPPGLPVLIHREMRRSVEKNPQIPSSYFQLANAIRLNMRQEGWWSGHPEPTLLYQLRQVELIAALRNAVNLAPDNVEYQRQLGDALMSQNLLDSALVHFTEASRLLDEAPIGEASLRKYFPGEYDKIVNAAREKAARKKADDGSVDLDVRSMARDHFDRVRDQMRKFVKIREVDVKRRKDDLDLKAAGADDMMRFHLAFRAPYTVTDMENNRREDPRGRGLALEAIKALERAKFTTTDKKNEEQVKREKAVRDINLVRLYCLQGQVQEAVQAYSRAKAEDPNFENVDIIAMIGAATGWYENVDHAMAHLQDEAKQALVQQAPLVRDVAVLALGLNQLADESTVGRIARGITIENLIFARTRLMNQAKAGAAEYAAVRGIYLMEQGDTAAALKAFDDALSSDLLFLDRPIAERYRELLKQEWK